MTLNRAQLDQLANDLPLLAFDETQDLAWTQSAAVQAYLAAYGLDFTRSFTGLRHGFGRLDVCNFKIATHYWLPAQPVATLVIVHGYYDHVGLFKHAINFALQNNFAVLTFDLPGHGLSSGDQAAIDSFDQYGDVLHEVLTRAANLLPQPLHALGQSTGAAVILNYLWRYEEKNRASLGLNKAGLNKTGLHKVRLNKIVLLSPLIIPRGWRSGRFLYYIVRLFCSRFQRGSSRSSHDLEFTRFVESEDPLQSRYLSLKWVGAMAQWHGFFLRADPMQRPMLVVQGTGDMTVAWRYNLKQIRKKLPTAEIHMIEDAGHQLINESPEYRDKLLDIVRRWFWESV